MFARCAEQFRRRYVCGEIIPPGVALIVGSSTHKGIELNMKHRIQTGQLLPLDAVKDMTRDAVMSRWEREGVLLTEIEEKKGWRKVRAEAIDTAVGLGSLHHSALAPIIKPTHVERPWRVVLDGFPYDMTGKIDLQEADWIIDTKTAGRTPPEDQIHSDGQLTVYAMAGNVLDHKAYKLRKDILIKTKTPKVIQQTTTRDETDYNTILRRVETLSRCVEKGAFPPTDPGNWVCSPRFCGYHPSCVYVKRGKR